MDDDTVCIQEEPSDTHEKLALLKSQVEELEKKTSSDAEAIDKLTQELRQCKASEELAKKDVSAIDNLYTASKEDLQKKIAIAKEFELKYEREAKINEGIEVTLRNEHKKIKHLREKLNSVIVEREAFEAFSAEVNAKLNESVKNLRETDTRLKQALSCNNNMEQKLKSLEELHKKSHAEAESATQRNLELEGLIQSSNAERDKLKKHLIEAETKLASMEQKIMETEKHLDSLKLKCAEKDRQIKEYHVKSSELTRLLKNSKEENVQSTWRCQVSEERVAQLVNSLGMLSDTKLELERKLKDLSDDCAEHKRKFREAHYRNIELEDMVEKSNSEKIDINRKVSELEILLRTKHYHANELEEKLRLGRKKYKDAEEELKQLQDMVSKLQAVAESSQQRSERLEIDLQAANAKDGDLINQLNVITDERKKFEQYLNNSSQKALDVENQLEDLKFELKSSKEKLEISEKDLEDSNVRENGLLEKLKLIQEEMEHKKSFSKMITEEQAEDATKSHSSFREQLDEANKRGNILKEQLALATQREASLKTELEASSEEKSSLTKMIDELKVKVHYVEASLMSQMEASSTEIGNLEKIIGDLTTKVVESGKKIEQILSENESIANANSKLKEKLELNQFEADKLKDTVNFINAEKNALETGAKKMETKLLQEIEKLKLRLSEAMSLKASMFSNTEICYLKGPNEVKDNEEIRKIELDGAFMKIEKLEEAVGEFKRRTIEFEKKNEGLSSMNLKLTDELTDYEIILNELKKALGKFTGDKEETLGQLQNSRKKIVDLRKQLSSKEERLQSKIEPLESSEKDKLLVCKLQESDDLAEESVHIQKEFVIPRVKTDSKIVLERQASINKSFFEIEVQQHNLSNKSPMRNEDEHQNDVLLLQNKVQDPEEKLPIVKTDCLEKNEAESTSAELKHGIDALETEARRDIEMKSSDMSIGEIKSAPRRRKSIKKSKSLHRHHTITPSTSMKEDYPLSTAIKFIAGIVLVSVVLGVIVGKLY